MEGRGVWGECASALSRAADARAESAAASAASNIPDTLCVPRVHSRGVAPPNTDAWGVRFLSARTVRGGRARQYEGAGRVFRRP